MHSCPSLKIRSLLNKNPRVSYIIYSSAQNLRPDRIPRPSLEDKYRHSVQDDL